MARLFLTVLCLSFPFAANAATYERTQLVFGNVELSIRIETQLPRDAAYREIENGFAIVKRQNEIFSTYVPTSEINRLNALSKPVTGVALSKEMADVLAKGIRFTRLTHGFFNITFEMPASGIDDIHLRRKRKVDLLRQDLVINPTGLVKGDTVDRILDLFKRNRRIAAALVAAGGDIGRFDRQQKSTTVPLHNPLPGRAPDKSFILNGDAAVSTSGQYERGRHIKRTRPSRVEHLQTSVAASDCTTSDALATGFLFMPIAEIRAVIQSLPGTRVIIYESDGSVQEL